MDKNVELRKDRKNQEAAYFACVEWSWTSG